MRLLLFASCILCSLSTMTTKSAEYQTSTWLDEKIHPRSFSRLALAVAKSSYLPIERFLRNGYIMENPSHFGNKLAQCTGDKSEMQAGLCYKPCNETSWASVKGLGPVCWGCPKSHPQKQAGLCYKRCPMDKPNGRMFLCYGDCPNDYRNDGLTCTRHVSLKTANITDCPWYDKCGLTFSRGCSKCPAGYKNDGCICRRDIHVVVRPRYNRGIGVLMKSYYRGVGFFPNILKYDPSNEQEACPTKNWTGQAFANEDTEVFKFLNHRQKIAVFGFRGTELKSVSDWLANFDLVLEDLLVNGTRLPVHRGVRNKYSKIAGWFERHYLDVPNDYYIVMSGHSQGGALASIAAVIAALKLARPPNAVITWGSMPAGSARFRKFYEKYVGCNVTINYVTKGDVLATLPNVSDNAQLCDMDLLPTSDFILAHSLYSGYGEGLKAAYQDEKAIGIGCNVSLPTDDVIEKIFTGFHLAR